MQAAIRELKEEAGLSGKNWQQLDAMCMLPRIYYKGHELWTETPYVIPEYSFSVRVESEPVLSYEHSEFKWCSETEARTLLEYDSNKIAAWELFQRLRV
ncbi:NUDIX domain-containing protein [Endozoicomonas numazuensis]|uniref:NUDIX domain-containing protein n=1 Tax=Endozoicomonas numazuensis TaxID=1137799 RepID=UPI0009DF8349|nr:NUDIX domain-containing protein [Endozoicomonas numazuensis]